MSTKTDRLIKFDDFYDMLSDTVRNNAYKEAIEKTVKEGDVVIDLGAGTGILGLMALRAGAGKVYMIEKSDAIELAKAVVNQNGFADQVVFIRDNSLDAIVEEKVDVIVTETLGNFGLDENMLEFLIDARDRWLKPNGHLIPENISLKLTPVESKANFEKLAFWKDIGGIDYSPAYEIFSGKMMVADIHADQFLANPIEFVHVDFYEHDKPAVFNKTYHAINRNGTIYGFAGWFEVELVDGIKISTSPYDEPTHWKQAFFPIKEAIHVVKKDLLEISMLVGSLDHTDNTTIQYEYRCTQRSKTNSP